jgi:predicted secreted protein
MATTTTANDNNQNGYEEELAAYEKDLADYLQERIKPRLSRSAIPLLARSIAKEITRREPPEPTGEQSQASDEQPDPQASDERPDFETDMHELQAELGEEWILRFSVHGEDGWLTAEKQDATQRVEAPDAQRLVTIVEAINEGGGRQP